jgi:hypothetical protein
MVSAHRFEVQGIDAGMVQAPEPLHTEGGFTTPAEHVWGVHWTLLPGKRHWVGSLPSHRLAQVPMPVQAVRIPRGVPLTVKHLPAIPGSAQAWH